MSTQFICKAKLRTYFQKKRAKLDERTRERSENAICHHLLTSKCVQNAKHIALYYACRHEVSLKHFIIKAWQSLQASLYLPQLCDDLSLCFALYTETTPLRTNHFHIPEPNISPIDWRLLPPQELKLVLVPLLAFDSTGHRLGQGGGYYDRTLKILSNTPQLLVLGIGFEVQRMCPEQSMKAELHDQIIDGVVTPQGLEWFSSQKLYTNPLKTL